MPDCTILPRLCFVHIPKTAGMSLVGALAELYGSSRSYRIGDNEAYQSFQTLAYGAIDQYYFVSGHFSLPLFREKSGKRWYYISAVREPVERLVSVYNYVTTKGWHPLHRDLGTLDREEFFHRICKMHAFQNEQCSYFATLKTAQQARKNIERFYGAVAAADNLPRLIQELSRVTEQSIVLKRTNVSKGQLKPTDLSEEVISKIKEVNSEDCLLYDWLVSQPERCWIRD